MILPFLVCSTSTATLTVPTVLVCSTFKDWKAGGIFFDYDGINDVSPTMTFPPPQSLCQGHSAEAEMLEMH